MQPLVSMWSQMNKVLFREDFVTNSVGQNQVKKRKKKLPVID